MNYNPGYMVKFYKLAITVIVGVLLFAVFGITGCVENSHEETTVSLMPQDSSPIDEELKFNYSVTWENPLPQGNHLRGVWGSSPTDVFAVGMKGTIIHYDGTTWEQMDSGTDAQLNDVWGTSANDVYACGYSNTILHYDGSSWNEMDVVDTFYGYNAIWASASNDVYAVGDGIFHYDGTNWSDVTPEGSTPLLLGIWGFSSDNVFAVGDGGTILHFDGSDWISMDTPIKKGRLDRLQCVWGNSPNHIIAGGETQLVYDGTSWNKFEGTYNYGLHGMWGSSGADIFAAGSHYIMHLNGTRWEHGEFFDVDDVFGFSSSDVFAVGEYGLILHFNGYNWKPMTGITTFTLPGIWGTSSSDMFAVGSSFHSTSDGGFRGIESLILRNDRETWSPMLMGTNNDEVLRSIWGTSVTDVFAVGGKELNCIECIPQNLGNSIVLHYDGNSWSYQSVGTTGWLEDIWGTSPTNIFAVGYNGLILHYDGISWGKMDSGTTQPLYGIWGRSPTEIYAVGGGGTILKYAGKEWKGVNSGTTKPLYSIWGYDDSDLYITGYGMILTYINGHWDSVTWDGGSLFDIYGTSPSNIYAVGEYGTILHYSGENWVQPASKTQNDLTGIWINSDQEVFITGDGGTILRLSN